MSIDNAIENAVASVKMEGYRVDSECVQWCKKLLEKEISMEQYIALVKQKSGGQSLIFCKPQNLLQNDTSKYIINVPEKNSGIIQSICIMPECERSEHHLGAAI